MAPAAAIILFRVCWYPAGYPKGCLWSAAAHRAVYDPLNTVIPGLSPQSACVPALLPCSFPFEIHDDALVLRKLLEHDTQQLAGVCRHEGMQTGLVCCVSVQGGYVQVVVGYELAMPC